MTGWDGIPHPDNARHDKYKLCVKGIEDIMQNQSQGMTACYIWIDFGCMDQDGNPAGELKQLDEIIRAADCLFTPIVGEATILSTYSNIYEDYKAEAWNADKFGYVNRGWCRIEMFFAGNIPALNDKSRVERFNHGLKKFCASGVRPHFLYGEREVKGNQQPILVPPIKNSYFDKLHPNKGSISVDSDAVKINELVNQLK